MESMQLFADDNIAQHFFERKYAGQGITQQDCQKIDQDHIFTKCSIKHRVQKIEGKASFYHRRLDFDISWHVPSRVKKKFMDEQPFKITI